MGTNFYWKKLPKEFEQYRTPENESILLHIGKRSAAGPYCFKCGTTFNRWGTQYVHRGGIKEIDWYTKCPICGSEGENTCSFTYTFLLQLTVIIQKMASGDKDAPLIEDEYGETYTLERFYNEVAGKCPIMFQNASEFS